MDDCFIVSRGLPSLSAVFHSQLLFRVWECLNLLVGIDESGCGVWCRIPARLWVLILFS